MPTIFVIFGLRFMFFANDHEPIHIHVVKDDVEAKFSVFPEIKIIYNHGLKASELKKARRLITENAEIIIERWNEFFNDK
jgi:hypothetical protein